MNIQMPKRNVTHKTYISIDSYNTWPQIIKFKILSTYLASLLNSVGTHSASSAFPKLLLLSLRKIYATFHFINYLSPHIWTNILPDNHYTDPLHYKWVSLLIIGTIWNN